MLLIAFVSVISAAEPVAHSTNTVRVAAAQAARRVVDFRLKSDEALAAVEKNFAELLRSFGARSETKPVWHISLFSNINLAIVVAISFGLQVWSHHNAILGRFLKTSSMPLADCFLLLAVGAIPLLILELVKVVRNSRRQSKTEP